MFPFRDEWCIISTFSLTIGLKTAFKDSEEVYKTAAFSRAAKLKLVDVVNPSTGLSVSNSSAL